MNILGFDLHVVADALNRFKLARIWQREFDRVRRELASYSRRELHSDLKLFPSEIPTVAAAGADQRIASFVRDHPEYRGAWEARSHARPDPAFC